LGALSALFVLVAVVGLASVASAGDKSKFNAHLSGSEEVPARETMAHGQANLQLTKDGTGLEFKLIVANIDTSSPRTSTAVPSGSTGPSA
jgi:hypothetical protein